MQLQLRSIMTLARDLLLQGALSRSLSNVVVGSLSTTAMRKSHHGERGASSCPSACLFSRASGLLGDLLFELGLGE